MVIQQVHTLVMELKCVLPDFNYWFTHTVSNCHLFITLLPEWTPWRWHSSPKTCRGDTYYILCFMNCISFSAFVGQYTELNILIFSQSLSCTLLRHSEHFIIFHSEPYTYADDIWNSFWLSCTSWNAKQKWCCVKLLRVSIIKLFISKKTKRTKNSKESPCCCTMATLKAGSFAYPSLPAPCLAIWGERYRSKVCLPASLGEHTCLLLWFVPECFHFAEWHVHPEWPQNLNLCNTTTKLSCKELIL